MPTIRFNTIKPPALLYALLGFFLLFCIYHVHKGSSPLPPDISGSLVLPSTCQATLVTAYYNISSKHTFSEYLEWMTNFLSYQDCMVIFVSPELRKTIRLLRPKSFPTLIIPRPINSSLVAQLTDTDGWEEQEKLDPELDIGHNRYLYWIWNEKSNFLKIAATINPFSSTYFAWLDIGAIRHSKNNYNLMLQHFPKNPGILLLQVGEFLQTDLQLTEEGLSQVIFTDSIRIGGGMIGGTLPDIERWHTAFYTVFRRYLNKGLFGGKDQSVMATTCLESRLCQVLQGYWHLPLRDDSIDWFRLQEYYMGKLDEEPVKLEPITALE